MTGVAVNVTLAPSQIVVWLAATDTDGVTLAVVTVMVLLVAVEVVVQEALLVIITLIWSLLARDEEVNVADVCPVTVVPFICH